MKFRKYLCVQTDIFFIGLVDQWGKYMDCCTCVTLVIQWLMLL